MATRDSGRPFRPPFEVGEEQAWREHLYMEGRNPRKYVYFAISLSSVDTYRQRVVAFPEFPTATD